MSKRHRPPWTREEVIALWRLYYGETGESPKAITSIPAHTVVRRLFGSHNNALKAAGLPTRQVGSQPGRRVRRATSPTTQFTGWRFDDRRGEHRDLKEVQRKKMGG